MAVFAPEDYSPAMKSGTPMMTSTTFSVWVCDQLTHSGDQRPNWNACGSFIGTKVGQ